MIAFTVNRVPITFSGDGDTPLLWVLRDSLGLTGTKFGCGIGQCGACTVHLDGRAQRACTVPVSEVAGSAVTTIEGLAPKEGALHPVQEAWLTLDVPQCGYCQAGQIMAAADFLARWPTPTDGDIDRHFTNRCRCGTYPRIREGIHRAAALMAAETERSPAAARPAETTDGP
ncbi:MAG: (2Fe-2S)-binding protein [Pseudomonadota bacterium]